MRRNHEVRVPYSLDELELIKRRASELGLKLSHYIRTLSLKARIEIE